VGSEPCVLVVAVAPLDDAHRCSPVREGVKQGGQDLLSRPGSQHRTAAPAAPPHRRWLLDGHVRGQSGSRLLLRRCSWHGVAPAARRAAAGAMPHRFGRRRPCRQLPGHIDDVQVRCACEYDTPCVIVRSRMRRGDFLSGQRHFRLTPGVAYRSGRSLGIAATTGGRRSAKRSGRWACRPPGALLWGRLFFCQVVRDRK
jgi:hypothetical protein